MCHNDTMTSTQTRLALVDDLAAWLDSAVERPECWGGGLYRHDENWLVGLCRAGHRDWYSANCPTIRETLVAAVRRVVETGGS